MFRITPGRNKYQYVIAPKERVLVNIVGILSTASVFALALGFVNFIRLSVLAAAFFTLPFIIILLYHFINAVLLTFYPGFDTKKHEKHVANYWRTHDEPCVGVFVPVAGEPISIVRQTVQAALKINYANKVVVICDDTPTQNYKALAKSLGCKYMPHDTPGVLKKAGNVNYALSQYPEIEQLLVLDADFIPRPEMLRELVPYSGDHVGIVQSPQHFRMTDDIFYRSKFEFGAALMQKDFYRITQVARNRFGSAICVGTNALYNRTALDQVGGFEGVGGVDPWTHSEDVNTGLKMLNLRLEDGKPYQIHYVPVQLAIGICPDNYYSFYKQQARWATGSFRLMFSRKTLFSKVLSPIQKFCYFSNALYYFYTIAMLSMPLYFMVLVVSRQSFDWHYTALFIPQLITTYLITPFVLRRKAEPVATIVSVTATAYTFVQAILLALIRRPLGWEATGSKTGGSINRFQEYKTFVAVYVIGVYGAVLAVAIHKHAFALNASILLQVLFLISCAAQVIHLAYLFTGTRAADYVSTVKNFLTVER